MTLSHHSLPARFGQTRRLIVLLHGFGSNGAAMLRLGKTLSATLPDTASLAPDAPDPTPGRPGSRMWCTIPEPDGSSAEEANTRLQASARLIDAYLDDQLAAHRLPASAPALLGFSQSAGMAYKVASRRRDQLAGVVAIAGRMKRMQALATEARSKPPFLILTGADDNLLTTHEGTQVAAAPAQASIPAMRILMTATGHGFPDEGVATARHFLKSVLKDVT
jgi:phospholipase/carboxylesterase